MPTVKEIWQYNIRALKPEKRVEIARELKDAGYTDKHVETYTGDKTNQANWDRNIAERARMVPYDEVANLKDIGDEPLDDVAVDALTAFDRVHKLDAGWDGRIDDPVAARHKVE